MPQPQIYRFGPSVRRLLAEFELDISSFKVSGPRGTLLKGDVLAAIASGAGSGKSSETAKLHKKSEPPKNEKTLSAPIAPVSLQSPLPLQSSGLYEDLQNSQIRKACFKLAIPHD